MKNKIKSILLFTKPKWLVIAIVFVFLMCAYLFALYISLVLMNGNLFSIFVGSAVGTIFYASCLKWLLYRRANGIKE